MLGIIGLNDNLSGQGSPAGPTGDLREELEGSLAGPVIGNVQGQVGGENSDQGHPGKIVTLGNHLRSDQEVDIAPANLA